VARLYQYGIDFAYICPDEEGIGQQVKRHLENKTVPAEGVAMCVRG
jgi:hypothetical protein